ncbi:hypothetical protein GCM10018952_01940 [Streptosporangium vulgare]
MPSGAAGVREATWRVARKAGILAFTLVVVGVLVLVLRDRGRFGLLVSTGAIAVPSCTLLLGAAPSSPEVRPF